jgi:hypothetical protein
LPPSNTKELLKQIQSGTYQPLGYQQNNKTSDLDAAIRVYKENLYGAPDFSDKICSKKGLTSNRYVSSKKDIEKFEQKKKQKLHKSTTKTPDKTLSLLFKNQTSEERDLVGNLQQYE